MIGGMAVNNVFKKLEALGQKTNCTISLDFYCIGKSHRNVQIDDCETKEHCSVDVNWELSEYEILKTIADAIEVMKERPKCCNCKHYHPDFFESCGFNCNNFSKYEDVNEVVTFNGLL